MNFRRGSDAMHTAIWVEMAMSTTSARQRANNFIGAVFYR
jgi:hypothetical protein